MSIRLMTRVWDSGAYSGGTLLVLLALCDWANDQGLKIFPYLETLAEKARLSVKQTRRTLEILIEDGVVKSLDGAPLRKGEIINLQLNLASAPFRDKMSSTDKGGANVQEPGQTELTSGTSAPESGTSAPPYIDNPSTEPPREPPSHPPSTAIAIVEGPFETDLAVQIFNQAAETCPKWTRCRDVTYARRAAIAARLKTHGLDGWRRAVALAAASGHLGGPIPATGSHQGWRMDISWFAKAEHFSKIIEGTYAPARGATNGREAAREGIMDFFQNQAGSGIDRP